MLVDKDGILNAVVKLAKIKLSHNNNIDHRKLVMQALNRKWN